MGPATGKGHAAKEDEFHGRPFQTVLADQPSPPSTLRSFPRPVLRSCGSLGAPGGRARPPAQRRDGARGAVLRPGAERGPLQRGSPAGGGGRWGGNDPCLTQWFTTTQWFCVLPCPIHAFLCLLTAWWWRRLLCGCFLCFVSWCVSVCRPFAAPLCSFFSRMRAKGEYSAGAFERAYDLASRAVALAPLNGQGYEQLGVRHVGSFCCTRTGVHLAMRWLQLVATHRYYPPRT